MFRLWSEWDIGEGDKVFASKEVAMNWLRKNETVAELAEQDSLSLEDAISIYFADDYFGFTELEIIS